MKFRRNWLLGPLILLLAACTSVPENGKVGVSPYQKAMTDARAGRYEVAEEQLTALRDNADTDDARLQAETGIAYVLYKKGSLKQAEQVCERLIKQHPTHAGIAYVYFLQGLAIARQGELHLDKIMQNTTPGKEYPEALRTAYRHFSKLVKHFPQSDYTEQAIKRSQEIRRQLASYELYMARYEMLEGNQAEALRRARYVTQYYSEPAIRKQALTLMSRVYKEQGDKGRAEKIERQLQDIDDSPVR